jgi:hypothetical protein
MIFNLTHQTLANFTMSYGVPLGWAVRAPQIRGETLEPNVARQIQHILVLEDGGFAPLIVKTHTTYIFGCQPLTSDDTLNPN